MQILYRLFRKTQTAVRQGVDWRYWLIGCLAWAFLLPQAQGEGSKDFISYDGVRLFYSANKHQQLKVYAGEGEFINLGTSHLGDRGGGTIYVYRPDGSLFQLYERPENSTDRSGIIFNSQQEQAGPTGGGSTDGDGYIPLVVPVQAGEAGVWTVLFKYPTPNQTITFPPLTNSANWTRNGNQPSTQRGILAWDITVSQNAAANEGGTQLTGRVYSNEYISVTGNFNRTTSPTFYLLTRDGFQYQIDFMQTDPFEFPLSSNTTGLIDGNLNPIYGSRGVDDYVRTSTLDGLDPNAIYQYNPQAMDDGPIISNKIFFNLPDPNMPNMAMTVNVQENLIASQPFGIWLYNEPQAENLAISNLTFIGSSEECGSDTTELNTGGAFVFDTNSSGAAVIRLDVNEDGDFDDPIDVEIRNFIQAGRDTIFWDGNDGLGNSLTGMTGEFVFNLQVSIQSAEIHIMVDDVENNLGGISFNLLNGPPNVDGSLFLYDHRDVGGPVSNPDADGNPQPTDVPHRFGAPFGNANFGNLKLLDYFSFINRGDPINEMVTITIVDDCSTPPTDDFDMDGIPDNVDIDDDNDGVLDRLEFCNPDGGFACLPGGVDPSGDEDGDGVQNFQDADDAAVGHGCTDADADGVCDDLPAVYDIDGDGVPDHRDLDSDNDGITDLYEAGHDQADANGDGIIDGENADFGENGFFNNIETDDSPTADPTYTRIDKDGDGVPDHDDLDSDNDGIYDVAEAGYTDVDGDNDGRIDFTSVDRWGLVNVIDPDVTGNGIMNPQDFDGDGVEDFRDLDSDNDGINDVTEHTLEMGQDPDGDGIIGEGVPTVDENGVAIVGNTGLVISSDPVDFDDDGIPDYHDLDTDNDGILDAVEGFSGDFDGDFDGILGTGIPVVNEDGQVINTGTTSTSNPNNADGDEFPDFRDLDSDDDGIIDMDECTGTALCNDQDDNDLDDYREPNCTDANTPVAQVASNDTETVFCSDTTALSYTVTNTGFNSGNIIYAAILPDGNILSDTLVNNAATITVENLTQNGRDTMKVVLVAENGCISDTARVFLGCEIFECTEENSPNIFVQTNTNGTVCPGDSVTYTIQSTGFQEGAPDFFVTFPDGQSVTGTLDGREATITIAATDTTFTGDGMFNLVGTNGCTSDTSAVNIFVAKVNAVNDGFLATSGVPLEDANILENDDSRDVNVTLVTPPNNGTATIDENGNLDYVSNDGYVGQDTLTYSICNMTCMEICDTAQVIIEVVPVDCDDTNTPELTVNITSDNPACPDDDATFAFSIANFEVGADVTVITPAGDTLDAGLDGIFAAMVGDGGAYTFIATNPNGCGDTVSVELMLNDIMATANDDGYTVTAGEVLTGVNPTDNDEYNGGSVTIIINPENGTATLDENNVLTYTPNDGFIGMDSLTYQICDVNCVNSCDTAQVRFNVTEVVCDDTTTPDLVVTFVQDVTQPVCIGTVLEYSFANNGAGENITVSGVFADGNTFEGGLQLNGSVTVNANTNGTATFIATADNGCADTVTVDIMVIENAMANDDNYNVNSGETLTGVNIFDNDTNNGGTFTIITDFQNGMGMIDADGNLTYTPNDGFVGTDMLTYEICDAVCTDQCDQATVTITVAGCGETNSPVIGEFNVVPDSIICPGDDLVLVVTNTGFNTGTITATFTLPDGTTQEVVLNEDDSATLVIDNIQNTFDFNGMGTVVLTSEDGCTSETISFDLVAPSVNAMDDNYTTQEGQTLTDVNILGNDSFDQGSLTILDDFDNGTATITDNGDLTYTPNNEFVGMDTLTYQLCDALCTAVCDTAQVIINVTMAECDEETSPSIIAFTLTPSGKLCPGDEATFMITGGGFSEGDINFVITLADGNTLTGTLNADGMASITVGNISPDAAGTVTAVLTAAANGCTSAPATVEIIVATITANDDSYMTEAGMTVSGNVTDNDMGDIGTVTVVDQPMNGTLTLNTDGTFDYTPNDGFAGTDTFTYRVCDADCPDVCDEATVTITIDDPCADKMVTANDDSATIEVGMDATGNVLDNDDFENVTINVTTDPMNGTVTLNDDGTYTYTPNADFSGTDSFTYEICDVECPDVCSSATVTITVNDPCADKMVTANVDSATIDEGMDATGNVLDNDDFENVTINVTTDPMNGTVTLNDDGTYTYSPNADFFGTDSFTYEICDVECPDVCSSATVTITVNEMIDPCDDKMVVAVDDNGEINQGETLEGVNVLANDDFEMVTITVGETTGGTATIDADGNLVFTSNPDFSGTATINYEICDVECPDVCDQATVTVNVIANVDPCENKVIDAVDDNFTATFRGTLEENVTTNDVAETFVATLNKNVDNGTLGFNSDGSFSYTPNRDFYGEDTFTYTLCDAECPDVCDEATVTLSVADPGCFIPNFITPNGDGDNDLFEIPCAETDFPNNRLTIYNRWGDVVFETDSYQNNWDGTFDGEPVAAGTYFYLFQPDVNNEECESGFVSIVR